MKKKELFIIVFLIPFISSAKIFKGSIGKYPIIIDFPITDIGKYSDKGGYFYETKRQKIIFSGAEGTENHIILENTHVEPKEKFDLLKNINGSYSGTWQNLSNNKTLIVNLSPLDLKSVKNNFYNIDKDGNIDPLWYVASSKLKFKQDTTFLVGEHNIEWYSDNIYGISFFRIASNKNQKLNKMLENKHWELISDRFSGCNCDEEMTKPFEIQVTGKGILSYDLKEGICYCYSAAHPSWGEEAINLDIQNDEVLDFDKVFSFSENPITYNKKNWKQWVAYRENNVAPKIVEILKKIDKTLLPSPKNSDDKIEAECYYLESELWTSLENWHLTKTGIIITHYETARGYGPCMNTFEIPYKYLKQYISPLYRSRIAL